MEVPIFNRQVGLETGGISTKVQPISEASTGLAVDEANINLGKTVQGMGEKLGAYMMAKQKVQKEQEVNDRLTSLASDVQENLLNGKDGALVLQGANTKGITPVFDERVSKLVSKYAEGLDPEQTAMYHANAKAHHEVWRSAVIKHESEQGHIADEQGIASAIKTDSGTFAMAPFTKESDALRVKALSLASDLSARKGETLETKTLRLQAVDDSIAQETIRVHPEMAGELLTKLNLSPQGKALVQGAQVEAAQQDIANAAMTYKTNPDGTPSLTGALEYAKTKIKDFTPEQQQKVISFVHSYVGVKTAEIEQGWEQNKKDFYDEAMKMYLSGANHDQITQQLVKGKSSSFSGMPATDYATKQDYIDKLFLSRQEAIDKRNEYLTQDQKVGLAKAELIIQGVAGGIKDTLAGMPEQQDMDKVFSQLVKEKASTMTGTQIVEYAKELSKEVTTPATFWGNVWPDTLGKGYKIQAEKEIADKTVAEPDPYARVRVKIKATGKTGTVPAKQFIPQLMEKI